MNVWSSRGWFDQAKKYRTSCGKVRNFDKDLLKDGDFVQGWFKGVNKVGG